MPALSNNNVSQFSVPSHMIFFNIIMASGLLVANLPAKAAMPLSISSAVEKTSAYKPFSLAHCAVCHSVALMVNWQNADVQTLRSTAGPTTKGPIPTANSDNLIDASLTANV